jgi:NAD(P)-dependent dehydrogenase (short-subunit alcohol dehydrogenase family)
MGWSISLDGRVAIVTGATRGIGKAIAAELAAAGAAVVVAGRSPERGNRAVAEISARGGVCRFVQADLTREDEVAALVDACVAAYGRLDIVVNNAAATDVAVRDHPVVQQSTEDFDYFLAASLRGAFWMFKYAITAMGDCGSFVSISSTASLMSRPSEPGYGAAKGAMNALARQVAVDYGPRGIRSNTLVLGFIVTNASAPLVADPRYGDQLRACVPGPLPVARDVANAVVFLASDASSGFNGATLVLDGGLSAMSPVPAFE